MNIDSIIKELSERVANNVPISPASWCEAAMRLEVLATNLDEELAILQAKMEDQEAQLLAIPDKWDKEMSSAKAKTLSKLSIDYTAYLKLKAKIKRIDSFIVTARKRSTISNF
jgi:hypothetical protein